MRKFVVVLVGFILILSFVPGILGKSFKGSEFTDSRIRFENVEAVGVDGIDFVRLRDEVPMSWSQFYWGQGPGVESWSPKYENAYWAGENACGMDNVELGYVVSDDISSQVLISEVYPNGRDEDSEFVEIYNPTSDDINLGGWRLEEESGNATTFGSESDIPAYGYCLIGFSGGIKGDVSWPDADINADWSLANDGEYLVLSDDYGRVVDNFAYGSDAELGEGGGYGDSIAEGFSVERKSGILHRRAEGNGYDTENNARDFFETDRPNPQSSTSSPERPPGRYESSGVVVSSVFDANGSIGMGNVEWFSREPVSRTEKIFSVRGEPSEFENYWSFLVDTTAPPSPVAVWPGDNVVENENSPTFRWEGVSDPSGLTYQLQIDQENDFQSPVYDKGGISENFHKVENILPDNDYYWRVRAVDNLGHEGSWSDNLKFEVIFRDFDVSLRPERDKVYAGRSALIHTTLEKIGSYDFFVDISVDNLPPNSTSLVRSMGTPTHRTFITVTTSEETSPGEYTIGIVARDNYGRVRTDEFTLSVLSPPTVKIEEIPAGESRNFSIGKLDVVDITVEAAETVKNASIYLKELSQGSEISPCEDQVYSYFEIETDNVSPEEVSSVKIDFEVLREWVRRNNVRVSSIRLKRYGVSEWNELDTIKVSEDGTVYYFEGTSSGFSFFAITGVKEEPTLPNWLTDWRFLAGVGMLIIILAFSVWMVRSGGGESEEEYGS